MKNQEQTKLVAVYGSLRQGLGNHPLLANSELVETTTFTDKHTMVSFGYYPALIPHLEEGKETEGNSIIVEVYKVNENTFRNLDTLEGYPSFYDRKQVTLDNGMEDVWIYFIDNPNYLTIHPIVSNGDWLAFYNS